MITSYFTYEVLSDNGLRVGVNNNIRHDDTRQGGVNNNIRHDDTRQG
mgnify:CR=1 FL=1